MTPVHFILSTVCIGFADSLIMGVVIGFLFHKSQSLTPQTWRAETNTSHLYSTLLSFLFGALFTLFYIKIGSHYVLPGNIWSGCKLGVICFAAFSFIAEVTNAIYINYDKKFMLGKLIASGLKYVASAIIAGVFM